MESNSLLKLKLKMQQLDWVIFEEMFILATKINNIKF